MHLPIAPSLSRPSLVVDLIGDLDTVLAEIALEALESSDRRLSSYDLTLDCTHVTKFMPDGVRALGRIVAERRLAGRSTSLLVDNARLRSQLKVVGVSSESALVRDAAADRHIMIARHAPKA